MKKLYLFAVLFLIAIGFVNALTLSSLTLQGIAGQSKSGTMTLTNNDGTTVNNITILASNLVSGSDNIPASAISISPNTISTLNAGSTQTLNVNVNIPSGSDAGTYNGAIVAYYGNQSVGATLTLIVQTNATPTTGFIISDINLGSDTQDREETISSTFRITNNDNMPLTITLSTNVPSQYQLILSQNSVTLNPGEFADIPFTVFVPDDVDSGKNTIGVLTARSGSITRTSNIFLTVENNLVFSKVRLESSDGDSETMDDGDTFDTKPNVDMTLTVTIKNEFDDEVDIEEITLDIDSDGDVDLSDEYDFSDLNDGERDTMDISFDIPSDADGSSDITLTLEGVDENGARHGEEITITVEVDRKTNEIMVTSAALNPSTISCDRRVTATFEIENTGDRDQDEAAIEISMPDFDIEERWYNIELDSEDTWKKSYTFSIPNNVQPGTYYARFESFYDNDKSTDLQTAELIVQKCGNQPIVDDNQQDKDDDQQGTGGQEPPIVFPSGTSGPSYGTSTGGLSFGDSNTYIIILAIAIFILVVIIIILLAKYVF